MEKNAANLTEPARAALFRAYYRLLPEPLMASAVVMALNLARRDGKERAAGEAGKESKEETVWDGL
jgi:hypothetical protein